MLFKDASDLKRFLAGNQEQVHDQTIMPFVRQAELRYLIPALGWAFYTELDTVYNLPPNSQAGPSAKQKAAIEQIQYALAYYTLLDAIPFLNVRVGDSGLQEGASQSSMPVRQWSYNELVKTTADNADVMLDQALLFLELNASDYPVWKNSAAYTVSKELLINTATELSVHLSIQGSRRAYLAIRPFIYRAEDLYILPALGQPLYDEMKQHIKAPAANAPPYRKVLLQKIQKAAAQWSYALALLEINFVTTGFGIKLQTESLASSYKSSISDEQLAALRLNAQTQAGTYMAELKKYLDANAADIKSYSSDDIGTARYQVPDNTSKPSFRV